MHCAWPLLLEAGQRIGGHEVERAAHLLPEPAERPREAEGVVERAGDVVLIELGLVAVGEAALVQLAVAQRDGDAVPEADLGIGRDGGRFDRAPGARVAAPRPLGRVALAPPERRADGEERERTTVEGLAPADVADRPLVLFRLGGNERPTHPLESRGAGDRVREREGDPQGKVRAAGDGRGAGLRRAQGRGALLRQKIIQRRRARAGSGRWARRR